MVDTQTSPRARIKKTVLITGAHGFIGSHATERLASRGYDVRIFTRPEGDMRSPESLREATKGVDWILHLAGSKNDEKESYEVNVAGARNLIEAAHENHVRRIVYVSTLSATLEQKGIYGTTKQLAEEEFKKSPVSSITLRPSIVYGDLENGVFGSMVKFSRLPITPVFGDGSTLFWPIHVDDFIAVAEEAAHIDSPFREFDVTGPDEISFNALLSLVGKTVHNKKVRPFHLPAWIGIWSARLGKLVLKKFPITESNILGLTQPVFPEKNIFSATFKTRIRPLEEGLRDILEIEESEAKRMLEKIARLGNPRPQITAREINLYNELKTQTSSEIGSRLRLAAAVIETSPASASWLLPRERTIKEILKELIRIALSYVKAL